MFPPKSLGLVLATCVYAAAARQSLSNLYDDCEFIVDQSRYDLCPLFHNSGQDGVVKVHAELAPAVQISYEISFGGPVSPQNGDSERDELQCPPGTWVCLRERRTDPEDSETYFTQAIPIAGRFAIDAPHTTTSTRPGINVYRSAHNGDLEIVLKEDVWRNKPQAAHFRFVCDHNTQEPSLPRFTSITAGTHNFEWSTPHACAKDPLSFNVLEEGKDAAPISDDIQPEGDGGQELVGSLPARHTARNLMIVFTVASFVVLGLGYLVRYPPPNVKRWVGVTVRKLPFRVGEGVLVRWAEEAMFINDEEDVMVNYEEEYDSDERIPLKPSPIRLSARYMDYGSARW